MNVDADMGLIAVVIAARAFFGSSAHSVCVTRCWRWSHNAVKTSPMLTIESSFSASPSTSSPQCASSRGSRTRNARVGGLVAADLRMDGSIATMFPLAVSMRVPFDAGGVTEASQSKDE